MLTVWRIVKAVYVDQAFTGEGARLYGGRWNSPGLGAIYTADSPALAALELLVQLNDPIQLPNFVLLSAELADDAVLEVATEDLPQNWRSYPAPPELQALGDRWIRQGESLALRVPSVVEPRQYNYVLNPEHPDFRGLRIAPAIPYFFDMRLLPKVKGKEEDTTE